MTRFDTCTGNQPPRRGEEGPGTARAIPSPSPIVGLVDDDGAAAFFGVSKRTFLTFIDAPWMTVRPIVLGPRLRRWSLDELRAAVADMPRGGEREQPSSLQRARARALSSASDIS